MQSHRWVHLRDDPTRAESNLMDFSRLSDAGGPASAEFAFRRRARSEQNAAPAPQQG